MCYASRRVSDPPASRPLYIPLSPLLIPEAVSEDRGSQMLPLRLRSPGNSQPGEQEYSPVRVSSTWINVAYGKKLRPGVFLGYLKNLGASDDVSGVLGTGIGDGLDQLVSASAELTYNLPHWKFGVEYMASTAWYGSLVQDARIEDTHSVTNHRVVFTALFQF